MTEPLLTVVVSCYNQADTVAQAIESVLMQKTDFPVRLIVTDDHSTKDDSVGIVRSYAAKYPDCITALLNDENGRYLKNVLRAMEQVKSEYFTLLDADDYWTDPNYLSDAVRFLRAHDDFTVYFRNVAWDDGAGDKGTQFTAAEGDFDMTFDDFTGSRTVFPQTTGAVFRNVIYKNGIPPKIAAAVGTIHERPYDGDVFRFLLHLHEGKAHFENKVSGTYRKVPAGVFVGMPSAKRDMIQAQCFVDYHDYFGTARRFFEEQALSCYGRAVADASAQEAADDPEFLACRESVERFCFPWGEAMRAHLAAVAEAPRAAKNGLICYTYNDGKAAPGYYAPDVMNIGDYIQSLAARQYLPSVDEFVDRDQLGAYAGGPVNMIMNAWHRLWDKCRVFSPEINPLMVAVHLNNPEDATPETVAYFKRHEPIGCRDFHTLEFLKGKGIGAYFSGCLTLTLGKTYRVPESERTDDIYFVDYRLGESPAIDEVLYPILNARKRGQRCYFRTHYYPLSRDVQGGLREAEALVREYARAGLVVTRNIHCALPCLALGTPVVFVIPKFDPTRFRGLMNFFNYAGVDEKGETVSRIRVDARGRVTNPSRHLAYAAYLERIAAVFGGGTGFRGVAPADAVASVPRKHYPEAEAETGFWRSIYHKRRIGNRRQVTLFGRFVLNYSSRGRRA